MDYNFQEIEQHWQAEWEKAHAYKVSNQSDKKPFYVLDMFPYPSGAGLHVGHPLGYIASDIYARYKRLKGFNVLHPMGYDSYGLPAEQYAIQTGQHPAVTTERNIRRYREQLDKLGLSFDWYKKTTKDWLVVAPILATVGLLVALGYWNDWANGLYFISDKNLYSLQQLLKSIIDNIKALAQVSTGSVADAVSKLPSNSIRMAMAVIGVIPILALYPFFQKAFVAGIALGGVKE